MAVQRARNFCCSKLGCCSAPSIMLVKEKGERHASKSQTTLPPFRLQPPRALLLKIYASLELESYIQKLIP